MQEHDAVWSIYLREQQPSKAALCRAVPWWHFIPFCALAARGFSVMACRCICMHRIKHIHKALLLGPKPSGQSHELSRAAAPGRAALSVPGRAVQRAELRSTKMAQNFAMSSMAGRLATPVKPRASRAQVAT